VNEDKPRTLSGTVDEAMFGVLNRRAQRKIKEYKAQEELNLVPYLDVMVNLIIFLLVTISVFLPLGMLSIFPLSVATPQTEQAIQQKQELTLTVFITHDGFIIAGRGGQLPPMPRKPDGEYDYDTLLAKAVEIKDAYPTENQVIISAERDIKYEVLVKAMDTLRNKGDRLLFYNVQLSAGLSVPK